MVGSEGSLGAFGAPRLTYSRCRFKGACAPIKGEPCLYNKKIEQIAVHKNGNGLRVLFIRNHLGLGSIRV